MWRDSSEWVGLGNGTNFAFQLSSVVPNIQAPCGYHGRVWNLWNL